MSELPPYTQTTTARGYSYRYSRSAARTSADPTILLLHGFPSTAWDWHKLVASLTPKGYGVIVPDLLGYGGTDKPLDVESYEFSTLVRDLCDILDAEGVPKVIVIGHDWGSALASRFYNYAPERVTAAGFLALYYMEPSHGFSLDLVNKYTREAFGYELFGYWPFFSREDSHKIIADHLDAFLSLVFPADPDTLKTDLAPLGKCEEWLLANRTGPRASYLTQEEYDTIRDTIATNGLQAAVNWYRSWVTGVNTLNAKPVPKENHDVSVPVFFGAAAKDSICRSDMGKETIAKRCKHPDTVVREYDGDHWIIFSHAEMIAEDLVEWIEGLRAKSIL